MSPPEPRTPDAVGDKGKFDGELVEQGPRASARKSWKTSVWLSPSSRTGLFGSGTTVSANCRTEIFSRPGFFALCVQHAAEVRRRWRFPSRPRRTSWRAHPPPTPAWRALPRRSPAPPARNPHPTSGCPSGRKPRRVRQPLFARKVAARSITSTAVFAEFVVKLCQRRIGVAGRHGQVGGDLLRVNLGLRRHGDNDQRNPALLELLVEIEDRRQRVRLVGFRRAADLRRVRAPEFPHREHPQLGGHEIPAANPDEGPGVVFFEGGNLRREAGAEFFRRRSARGGASFPRTTARGRGQARRKQNGAFSTGSPQPATHNPQPTFRRSPPLDFAAAPGYQRTPGARDLQFAHFRLLFPALHAGGVLRAVCLASAAAAVEESLAGAHRLHVLRLGRTAVRHPDVRHHEPRLAHEPRHRPPTTGGSGGGGFFRKPVVLLPNTRRDGATRSRGQRAAITVSVVSNLLVLGFFKYFNLGVDSYNGFVAELGWTAVQWHNTLNVRPAAGHLVLQRSRRSATPSTCTAATPRQWLTSSISRASCRCSRTSSRGRS